jgi:hypothetical protein
MHNISCGADETTKIEQAFGVELGVESIIAAHALGALYDQVRGCPEQRWSITALLLGYGDPLPLCRCATGAR